MQKKATPPASSKSHAGTAKATKTAAKKEGAPESAPPAKVAPARAASAAKPPVKDASAARSGAKTTAKAGHAEKHTAAKAGHAEKHTAAKAEHAVKHTTTRAEHAEKHTATKPEHADTPAAAKPRPRAHRTAFLESQKRLLLEERDSYMRSAEALKAQADSLALEHEPGDVQFDEEGGEGGTANVDREMDLHLSAQARATVAEIDRALEKIAEGIYGLCEQCHQPIPEARLEALPYAALCVSCKSGGLSSRR
jgi:DnaK suppressor protein